MKSRKKPLGEEKGERDKFIAFSFKFCLIYRGKKYYNKSIAM